MPSFTTTLATIASFICIVNALTFTSPDGGSLDLNQAVTVKWTSISSDPSTFSLVLDNTSGVYGSTVLATGISTSAGSYIVAPGSMYVYGSNFVFQAQDGSGTVLATSPSFSLAQGSFTETTGADGSSTVVQITNSAQQATSSGVMASATMSNGDAQTTLAMTGASSTMHTSTTVASRSSSTASPTSSSASSSASSNAQTRLMGSSELVFGAAGILSGVVALLA